MAKEYSKNFYNSYRWRRCAKAYAESKLYICERCHGLKSINKADGTRQRWVAVSYTHLDVYKRQATEYTISQHCMLG